MALRPSRPASPERLDAAELRARFARRFAPLWQAAGGMRLAPGTELAERIGEAVADGRLAPSRARTLAGYLLLTAAGVPQGARRTTYELERECRELGLLASARQTRTAAPTWPPCWTSAWRPELGIGRGL